MRFAIYCFLLLVLSSTSGTAQEIGTELCSCAPNTYTFTLDFSLFCPPVNITLGDAVQATSCLVSPFGNPQVEDLVPVSVQSIDILELGQDLRVLVQENLEGNFGDGDTFTYASITASPDSIESPVDIPRALQLNLLGLNANDEPIINVYIITFTNDCGTYPVLQEGQSAGWTRFSDLGPPDREFCPLAPEPVPTSEPTSSDTTAPTAASSTVPPTKSPTLSPTAAPSFDASPFPSDMPSLLPSGATQAPTTGSEIPSDSPSLSPTSFPSERPVDTESPVETQPPPTDAPSSPATAATDAPVTAAPVTAVTAAPVTAVPVTAAPVTAAPVTAAPVTTAAPMTAAPVTAAPVTAELSMSMSMGMSMMVELLEWQEDEDLLEMEFGVPKRAADARKSILTSKKTFFIATKSDKSDKSNKSGKGKSKSNGDKLYKVKKVDKSNGKGSEKSDKSDGKGKGSDKRRLGERL